jgi:hypothetical protein
MSDQNNTTGLTGSDAIEASREPDPQLSPMWVEHQIGTSKWTVYPDYCDYEDHWITSWNVEHPSKGVSSLCSALVQEAVRDINDGYSDIPHGIMRQIRELVTELHKAGVY